VSRGLALPGALSALVFLSPPYAAPARASARALPRVLLWAWERPEDLRALDSDTGVAFLAQTITIGADRAARSSDRSATLKGSPSTIEASPYTIEPRRQPLRVDPATALVAVTRVEVARSFALASAPIDAGEVAAIIARTATLPRVVAVQVDFDATASERPFYRRLLERLRARLNPAVALSITALASWCVDDGWLRGLPLDEAIPMLFRMGPANEPFLGLARSPNLARAECRAAVGVSMDERHAIDPARRRVYVFNPKPWTARTIADARREFRR